ncbi:MAG: hypothetical protein ILNGONEN_01509 [Syntrophorhabdaceae bacterium]|nr:hypothetical protein [Syntrophorhabdaceae bacterium]
MSKISLMIKHRFNIFLALLFCWGSAPAVYSQTAASSAFTLARIKYRGGGDWYNDPSIIPNLLKFMRQHTTMNLANDEQHVELMEEALFAYPVVFLTGHGKITFSPDEARRLREYLLGGGFLYADDDYGMDKSFREEMKKVFPDKPWVEIPFNHPIYHCHFDFPNGVPKTHEHDGRPPKGFGLFHEGRMIAYYTWETNISDGWADPDIHGDPPEKREEALKMGTNIVVFALTQ